MQGAWQGVVKKNAAVGGWGGGVCFEICLRFVFGKQCLVFEKNPGKKPTISFYPRCFIKENHMDVLQSYFCFPSALKKAAVQKHVNTQFF
jgi:hypothetical protein